MSGEITAIEVSREWLDERREVIVREGYALRAGVDAEGYDLRTIQIKSLTDNRWLTLPLPNKAPAFTRSSERDVILRLLTKGSAS